jgi:hypothetical protein
MPKVLIIWFLPFCFLYSCKKDGGLSAKKGDTTQNVVNVKSLDTMVQDRVLDTAKLDYVAYKSHIENPQNGFIKKLQTDFYDLEVMYRPVSYEALLGMESFKTSELKKNQEQKAQVLSFSIKRTDKRASVMAKPNDFKVYLVDDSTGGQLEPVYFMSDHKLGTAEVFYCVFDRAAATHMLGDVLHLVWKEQEQAQDIYYTQRILKQDFIHIHDVN